MNEISLYFHIPFCRRRCGYCDFNTFAGLDSFIPKYVDSICQETQDVLQSAPNPFNVHTIYFGGGTPSLLSINHYTQIFSTISTNSEVKADAEISLEANPETVTQTYIHKLREIGFTRISFGMQSASPEDLRVLDRQHRYGSVVEAVQWSKQAGFSNINLDLIFGIPGQSRESWQHTLALALGFNIDHFSIYSLIVEEGTRLKRWIERGIISAPDDDLGAEMYEDAMDILADAGYEQYEISNWCRTAESRCRHNLQYWRFLPYLGIGAGAHGFYGNTRTENRGGVVEYIQSIANRRGGNFPAGAAAKKVTVLSEWDKIQENMMVSLRLTEEGISLSEFTTRHKLSMLDLFKGQIERLLHSGLIEFVAGNDRMRLTRKGRLFGNRVFSEFVGNEVPRGFEYLADQKT